MNRAVRAAALLGCAAGLTVLAACGGEPTAGEPVATDPPASEEESTPASRPSSESETPEYSLTELCGLLEPEEAVELGGSPEGRATNSTSTGADLCTWGDKMSLVAGVQPGVSTEGMKSTADQVVSPAEVAGMPAVRKVTASLEACEILVDLPSGNLFSVSAAPLSAGEGKYDPCTVADEFAAITVPRVKND